MATTKQIEKIINSGGAVQKETIGDCTLYCGDCLEILPIVERASAIITDPPYMGVVKEPWDNQWATDQEFLDYVELLLAEFRRILVGNGSLYFFASSRMSSRIEVEVRKYFHVLNNIVWDKGALRNGVAGSGIDVTALRRFWSSTTERIIFAEQREADEMYQSVLIDENASYWEACEKAKGSIIGDYLNEEFRRAGVTRKEIAALFPSKTGGLTGCVSNWINGNNFPTSEQYQAIREYLNSLGSGVYLRREYEDLRREYEDLRREYEDLRREYEDLRRPFYLNKGIPWGEVWSFPPLKSHARHPCEKPKTIMSHIVGVSTRVGDVVVDPFAGTGTTGVACVNLGRKFVGVEINERHFSTMCERIEEAYKTRPMLFEPVQKSTAEQQSLF